MYYQCELGRIFFIGKDSLIANNVGLITANHNPHNVQEHLRGGKTYILVTIAGLVSIRLFYQELSSVTILLLVQVL